MSRSASSTQLGAGGHGLRRRPTRHRRRHHAVRSVLRLSRAAITRSAGGRRDRRLALRQHHQRMSGRVRPRARRHGEPRTDSRRPQRRRGVALPGHHVAPGFSGAESGDVRIGDSSPSSRRGRSACARRSARGSRAPRSIIGVDAVPERLELARTLGADVAAQLPRAATCRGDQAADGRPRRRRRDRSARHAADLRERAARPPARRHALEPRRVLRQAVAAVRRVCRGPGRPDHRHHALPGRQGAHAAADEHRANGRVDSRRSSRIASRSIASKRPTTCSAISAMA